MSSSICESQDNPATLTVKTLARMRRWVAWQTENRPDGKPTKVGFKILNDGRKVRIAKRSGEEIAEKR